VAGDSSLDASFAFWSAVSFPGIPQWPGTHCRHRKLLLLYAALSGGVAQW